MNHHVTSEEIAAAVAGLELEPRSREHLENCVVCRAEATDLAGLITARRDEILAEEPDWDAQERRIMARLPAMAAAGGSPRPRWLHPVLAIAAVLVLAVGIGVLRPDGPGVVPGNELAVEEILAEMDELLADDSIPGFEIIDPEMNDLETYFENGAS